MVRPVIVIVIAIVIATFENGRLSSACVEYDHVPWQREEAGQRLAKEIRARIITDRNKLQRARTSSDEVRHPGVQVQAGVVFVRGVELRATC